MLMALPCGSGIGVSACRRSEPNGLSCHVASAHGAARRRPNQSLTKHFRRVT
jgi:hypothetical protein